MVALGDLTWSSTAVMTVVLAIAFSACSGGSPDEAKDAKPKQREDFVAQASDFRNLHTMTKVRGFFIDNRLDHQSGDDDESAAHLGDGLMARYVLVH
jgi:hypothetical protein